MIDQRPPTHRHKLNGLEVAVIDEHRGIVTYLPAWSLYPRDRDSTAFHRLYDPIGETS